MEIDFPLFSVIILCMKGKGWKVEHQCDCWYGWWAPFNPGRHNRLREAGINKNWSCRSTKKRELPLKMVTLFFHSFLILLSRFLIDWSLLSLCQATAATTVGSVKSAGLALLLLSFLLYVADSYPSIDFTNSKTCLNCKYYPPFFNFKCERPLS